MVFYKQKGKNGIFFRKMRTFLITDLVYFCGINGLETCVIL